MSEVIALAALEFRRGLRRPAFWLLLAGLAFVLAFLLLRLVETYQALRSVRLASAAGGSMTAAIVQPWMQQAGLILMALAPLLTMDGISGDRRRGTWRLPRGAGLGAAQIVAGKLLGAIGVMVLPLLLVLAMPLSLWFFGELDFGHWASAAVGLTALLWWWLAIGVFCSSMADDPLHSVWLQYGLLLLLALFHFSSEMPGVLAPTLYWLSPFGHFIALTEARFDSADLLWFVTIGALFGWLAVWRLRREERRPSVSRRFGTLALGLTAFGMMLALVTRFHVAGDWSAEKLHSLPMATAAVLQWLEAPLEFEAVVNDDPVLHRRIRKALAPYLRADSRVSLRFTTPEAAAGRSGRLDQRGRLRLHYRNQTDEVTSLGENELLRSLKKLIEGRRQWIVFLEGHGEKSLYDGGPDGYSTLDRELKARGFQTQTIDLLKLPAIPDNTTLLVIAAPTKTLLPGEAEIVSNHLNDGGDLLLFHDPDSSAALAPLLEAVGVEVLPGVVIDADQRLRKLLAIRHPAIVPVTDFAASPFPPNARRLLLPLASAVKTIDGDWRHRPLLRSNSDSWNETGPLEGHVRYDAHAGEQNGPLDLALLAERGHGGRTQRVVVIGDSDFLGNQYLGILDNADYALALFDWLTTANRLPSTGDTDDPARIDDERLLPTAFFLLLGLPLLLASVAVFQWRKQRTGNA